MDDAEGQHADSCNRTQFAYIICDMIILDIKRSLGGKNLDPLPAVVYKQQFRQKGYKIPVSAVGVNCSCYHLGWQGGGMSG